MKENNIMLNKVFTQYVLRDLIKKYTNEVYCTVVKRYLNDNENIDNGELISKVYNYMSKNYRNEYFYQNTLLNKLLLGRHSINTTTALTQISIEKSKADLILINGKAVVYEIKTELDSFSRLSSQLTDYYKAFTHICVITCEENYKKLNEILKNTSVGICILSNKNTLQFRKLPQKNLSFLKHRSIFKILHKKEFENILLEFYKNLPKTSNVFYYEECYKWFEKIPIENIYKMFLKELKKRNKIIKEYFFGVPYELKSLMYFYNATSEDYLRLNQFLKKKYGR